MYSGEPHTTDVVAWSSHADMAAPRSLWMRSMYAENLLRGLTCHVRRSRPLSIVCGSIPCEHDPGVARHAMSPASVPSDWTVLAMGLLTVNMRSEPKNHSRSLLIGPPCVTSKSW